MDLKCRRKIKFIGDGILFAGTLAVTMRDISAENMIVILQESRDGLTEEFRNNISRERHRGEYNAED